MDILNVINALVIFTVATLGLRASGPIITAITNLFPSGTTKIALTLAIWMIYFFVGLMVPVIYLFRKTKVSTGETT